MISTSEANTVITDVCEGDVRLSILSYKSPAETSIFISSLLNRALTQSPSDTAKEILVRSKNDLPKDKSYSHLIIKLSQIQAQSRIRMAREIYRYILQRPLDWEDEISKGYSIK